MLSKEAEQSIKRFKSFSVFMSSMYESPGNMSKSKRRFFRWFINLQGILGPKVEGTIKEELSLDGINTWKVSTPKSDPNRILLYYHGGAYSMGSPKSH